MIKVKDEKGLVRDPVSKAILNVDYNALQEHRRKRKQLEALYNNNETLNAEVSSLRDEIQELKQLFNQLKDTNR